MKTRTQTAAAASFDLLTACPKTILGCARVMFHAAADYASACQAIESFVGFSDRLSADQSDYLNAVSTFVEAYDQARVKWPKGTPLDTLKVLEIVRTIAAS